MSTCLLGCESPSRVGHEDHFAWGCEDGAWSSHGVCVPAVGVERSLTVWCPPSAPSSGVCFLLWQRTLAFPGGPPTPCYHSWGHWENDTNCSLSFHPSSLPACLLRRLHAPALKATALRRPRNLGDRQVHLWRHANQLCNRMILVIHISRLHYICHTLL